jgi:hypothetical protein
MSYRSRVRPTVNLTGGSSMAIAHGTRSDADHADLLERPIAQQGVGRLMLS